MNERIKELALESGAWHQVYDEKRFMIDSNFDVDRFAELIVLECIDTVSDCSVEYCTRPQIVSEIKQHFGVEE
jgi:hypothetical protein